MGSATTTAVHCPACGTGLLSPQDMDPRTGMVRCSCGHEAFVGYIAELSYLDRREEWLRARIAGGDAAPSADLVSRYGVWDPRAPSTPVATPVATPSQPAGRGTGVQTLLLGIGALLRREEWLRARIAGGDAAPSADLVSRYGVWDPRAPSTPVATPVATPSQPAGRGTGVQTLLLGIGALLLVVAAAVFTAVAWTRLGATGQLVLVVAATVGVSALAIALRRRLHGTAEALAALGFGLVVVDLVAAPGLEILPADWLDVSSPYWLVTLLVLAGAALLAGHRFALRSWVWLGWMALAGASGVGAAVLAEAAGGGASATAASLSITAVTGVLLVGGSWVSQAMTADRWPMVIGGSVCVGVAAAGVAAIALSGDAVLAPTVTTVLTTAVLLGLLALMGSARPVALTVLAGVLVGVAAGLVLALPLPDGALWAAPLVGLAGAAVLVGAVLRGRGSVGLLIAVPLWLTWLALLVSREGVPPSPVVPDAAGIVLGVVAVACLAAAWLGQGSTSVSWLAWPAAPLALAAAALLAPQGFPDVLEAWSLPFAAALLASGLVSCHGRSASSLERVGPALTVALLPSALATWTAPWVTGSDNDPTGHLVRLVLVLAVSGVLAVVGARMDALGVLLPSAAALLVAGLAQVWTGLDALPRWVALGLVGGLLVLAGARFEWVRGEGRRARAWVHQMS